jgi:hypothetical protein
MTGHPANEKEILGGDAKIIGATRVPCPVCGHPTGDCTGDFEPPTRLLGPTIFPSLQHEEIYVVPEDVYEERQVSSFVKINILVAQKGAAMPVGKARELGLI